jgi:transcriptional regulator with XRE-family HTH domain
MVDTPAYLIRSRREALWMSRKQLAEGICHPAQIGHYETARMIPTDAKARLIAERLDIPVEYFFMVVEAQRKIEARLRELTRVGAFRRAVPVLNEMARREKTPAIRERYEAMAKEFVMAALRGDLYW